MNAPNTTQASSRSDGSKMLQTMVGIGVICALLIVVTYEGTLPMIEKNKAEALEKAIFQVLPGISSKKNFRLDDTGSFVEMGAEEKAEKVIYAGYDAQGKLTGLAVEASGMGFADVLRVLYGYDPEQQKIIGFYVLESKETPGLGDKIEKDPGFLANFEALDVSLSEDQSQVKQLVVPVKHGSKKNAWEVDCITGATISSRAIGNIIGASTAEWAPLLHKNKASFQSPGNN